MNVTNLEINIHENQINKKLKTLFIYLVILLLSLNSYYYNLIKFAPFPPIGVILIIITIKNFKRSSLLTLFFFETIFIFPLILGFINNGFKIYLPTLIGSFLGPLFFILFVDQIQLNFKSLVIAIKYILITLISLFYLQVISFYFFGYELDYMILVTGEQSRFRGFGFFTGYIRPSSIFNEPATYSLFVFAYSVIYYIHTNKLTLILILSVLSLLFTLSSSGLLLFLFFVLFVLKNNKYIAYFIFISLLLILLYNNTYILDYFESRYSNGLESDNSTSTRFINAFDYFQKSNLFIKIFGIGIGYTPPELDSVVGSGIAANILSFGIFFNLLFFNLLRKIFIKYNVNFISIISFFVLMFTTMTFINLHFWLFLALFCLINSKIHLPKNIE